jgi:hypothetical protein
MNSHDGAFPAALLLLLGVYAVVVVFYLWGVVRIIRRSGYSGWWALIGLVPIVNIVMFFVFAFKKAPTELELEQLRAWANQARNQYPGQAYSGQGY